MLQPRSDLLLGSSLRTFGRCSLLADFPLGRPEKVTPVPAISFERSIQEQEARHFVPFAWLPSLSCPAFEQDGSPAAQKTNAAEETQATKSCGIDTDGRSCHSSSRK